jgi:hypothetical protein
MNQSDTDRDGGVDAAELPELEGAKLRLLPNLQAAAQAERDSAPTVDFKTLLPKAAAVPPAPTPVGERLATWLQIRQAFLDEKLVEKPATLSFSTADLSDETVDAGARRNQWSIAAAVILKPSKWVKTTTRWELYPILAYEAALSSGLKKDTDSITHRVGVAGSWLNRTATVAHGFSATVDYNTDRSYASTVVGGTLQYTPAVPSGEYRQVCRSRSEGRLHMAALSWLHFRRCAERGRPNRPQGQSRLLGSLWKGRLQAGVRDACGGHHRDVNVPTTAWSEEDIRFAGVVVLANEGLSVRKIAATLGLSRLSVQKYLDDPSPQLRVCQRAWVDCL